MFHPDILAAYGYARVYSQRNAVDARTERSVIALRAQAAVLEVDTHPEYLDLIASMGV